MNLVVEIGRLLIALSEEGNRIFEPTESLILIPQVFETLIDISSSRDNQLLLGAWHRLLLAVNWFLSRKLNWNATSNMQTFKNTLYCNGIEVPNIYIYMYILVSTIIIKLRKYWNCRGCNVRRSRYGITEAKNDRDI